MAVYRRNYAAYTGALTPAWSRSFVLFRYARQNLFRSKLQTALFALCFFYPLACLLAIYLTHNLSFLDTLGASAGRFVIIDSKFFFYFVNVQGVLAFLLTAFTGPGLISPDIANGALPLYFCRPFSRAEYVLGKSTRAAASRPRSAISSAASRLGQAVSNSFLTSSGGIWVTMSTRRGEIGRASCRER